ncbi:TPA: phage major capsid protein [Salmonella enterica subsp. enterica serovar Denver]|nr:phage major capsid protein [Salmonella enterica subsp. enterica serovar Denver]ECD5429502.1 phage major capsid protein [Salmonella enterica subsp. enterica serovar Denver]ECE7751943.1 phage major capsid protein [Salmonella enterica subsp. enterica serovar Ngili]HCM3794391.1 phage major capsid protein [Salmonella enterica subsp. enterica serovar Denver]
MDRQKKSTENQPQTIGEVSAKLNEIMSQVKNFGEDVARKMQSGETVTEELKQRTDESLTQMAELKERLTELEQKSARRQEEPPQEIKTLGQMVIESDAFKDMDSSARKGIRVQMSRKELMNVTATTGAGTSATNSLVVADRVPGIITPPERTLTIRDLLIPGETDSNAMEFVQETGFTNNAAPVPEGSRKPQSEITFDLKTAHVRTLAHTFKASRQILDDARGLASYIDGRARYGLRFKEEQQLLSGDGTGANVLGILPQASAFNPQVTVFSATPIDRLRLAILQAVLAEYPASGFVLNPIDWAAIELTKDSEGRYIIAQPVNGGVARLWGLPVVETQAMAQNHFLTGAFSMAAQIFDRMEIEVLLSTENEDDFVKNMVTIRAEERLALAVYRPEAFVTGQVSVSQTP